ncbi:hypothetical protein JRQ81_013839 [Phrynocephalus forsythii]|uniref:L1 transposable element RRM domain-containing protein n=1 Tax=Phrynocephalus forsythii TaxID=171643 RepID=A0A9Q1B4E8_9SAUR|nr:hypothetical protein JRQ81_013839 [Phrynocephalus forsythii]
MANKGSKKLGSAPSSTDSSPAQSITILELMGKETLKDVTKEQTNKDMETIMAMFLELKAEIKSSQQKIEERIDKLHDKIEETVKNLETEIEMEKSAHMVRIKGVEEMKEQDLLNTIIQPLAERMGLGVKELENEIEFIHRINSRFAKMNKLPRDVRVTFVRREMKERVMRIMSEEPLTILGKEVVALKETPRRIREIRKNYRFLTEELNKDNIRFRWLLPEGMIVNWQAKNIRLETIQEAREFYKQNFKENERDHATELNEDNIGNYGNKHQRQRYKKVEVNLDQEARAGTESQINTRKKKRA